MPKTKKPRREKLLNAEDLLAEIELAERAINNLCRQAEGSGATSLHNRVAFYYADLKQTRRKLEARINTGRK